jgi:hypothetical protein
MAERPGYDDSVFVNCPFDDAYLPLFRALVFVIQECGFRARCSLEVEDSGEERIRKIKRIIRECRYGIHDISRTEPDPLSRLPRFNMPLELGLFLGAQEYGVRSQKAKRSLILDRERYRYQRFCSDIAGQDIRSHDDEPHKLIAAIRGMLVNAREGAARIPGATRISERFSRFEDELAGMCASLHVRPDELEFVELRAMLQEWQFTNPWNPNTGSPARA